MDLEPYHFEMVFTGLCVFTFDDTGATVLLVNATDPARFQADFADGLEPLMPRPHFPRLSYSMSQQIRQGVVPRSPKRVFPGVSGEEVGICNLEGEDLTLDLPGAASFQRGALAEAPRISSLVPAPISPLCFAAVPNSAVTTRLRVTQGALETLRLSFAGLEPLEIDFRTHNTKGTSSGNPHSLIAEQLVLRADDLTRPVEIRSASAASILLRPDRDANGTALRPVVTCLSNYHEVPFPPLDAAYDLLWLYELLDLSTTQPSRLDLPIPVYLNSTGGFTGSSAACPPGTF